MVSIKKINVEFCPDCKLYYFRNKRLNEKSFIDYISNLFIKKYNKKIKIEKLINQEFLRGFKKILFEANSTKIEIIIQKKQCKKCAIKKSQYYQAILLISKKDISQEKLDKIEKFIKDYCKKKDLIIVKTQKSKKDIKFNMSDWRKTQSLVNSLIKNFSGYVKITRSLYSLNKQTSKKVYRTTFNYVPFNFEKNDFIKLNGQYYYIISASKDVKVAIINKNLKVKEKKLTNHFFRNKTIKLIKKRKAKIISLKPLMIMFLDSYETAKAFNLFNKNYKIDDLVDAVTLYNKIIIV